MNETIGIALIYGSTREGRFCDTIAAWAGERIRQRGGFRLDVIDPAAMSLPVRHEEKDSGDLPDLRRRLERADAFVIVVPEYNHSFPAALKFVIDSAYAEWQAKPVAFVSYGGGGGGTRAVEQLRLVFAELHAVGIRDTVSLRNPWARFDTDGGLPSSDHAHGAMHAMLSRLQWWAVALRRAREAMPYDELAA